jgi:glutamate racemase
MNDRPVGFFDSGVGGLGVWRETVRLLPRESTVYLGDDANCPYGEKSPEEVRELAFAQTRRLLELGCKAVVVACNTATAAAIDDLRREFPEVPFVGMEPAVKPAALSSKSGVVGVLATRGTFNGRLYRATSERFASETTVLMCAADDFVELVERGETRSENAQLIVRRRVEPLLDAGADILVLGCTHFPFLRTLIESVAAGRARIIDPAPAVARQVERVLAERGLLSRRAADEARDVFETTGDLAAFEKFVKSVKENVREK